MFYCQLSIPTEKFLFEVRFRACLLSACSLERPQGGSSLFSLYGWMSTWPLQPGPHRTRGRAGHSLLLMREESLIESRVHL